MSRFLTNSVFLGGKTFLESVHYLIAVIVVMAFFLANLPISGPVHAADEGGYLSNAAAIAGFSVDAASSYYAGYSLFLAPAFLLTEDPKTVFVLVKLANSLMWGATTLILFYLVNAMFPGRSRFTVLLALCVALAYPAWIAMAGFAMSTSAFVLVFSLSALFFMYVIQRGGRFWVPYALSVGFLYWVHPTAAPVLLSAIFASLIIALLRKELRYWLLFCCCVVGMVAVFQFVLTPVLSEAMTLGDFAGNFHYPLISGIVPVFLSLDGWREFFIRSVGSVSYIGMATVGIVFVPFFSLIERRFKGSARDSVGPMDLLLLYLGLSFLGTIAITSAVMTGLHGMEHDPLMAGPRYGMRGMRLDQWMHGRYVEGVIAPLIALGVMLWTRRLAIGALAIVALSLAVFSMGIPERLDHYQSINGLGLWQPLIFQYSPTQDTPATTLRLWALCFVPLAIIVAASRKISHTFVLLVVVYLCTSTLQISHHHNQSKHYALPRYAASELARDLFADMECVKFDQAAWKRFNTFLVYAFHFHPFDFVRVSREDWVERCAGPFLSLDNDIDSQTSDAVPLTIINADKFVLWGVKKQIDSTYIRALCPVYSCVEFTGRTDPLSLVGKKVPGGFASDGRAGYLLVGPYAPVMAGRYSFELSGHLEAGEQSVVVEIVGGNGDKTFATFGSLRAVDNAPGNLVIREYVDIEDYVHDLEIRVKVGSDTVLRIEGYRLQRLE